MINEFYVNNRHALWNKIEDGSLVILNSGYQQFKSADAVYNFVVNKNFYYLTGINQPDVTLVIGKYNNQYYEWLFLEEIDEVMAKWVGRTLTKTEASEITGINELVIKYNDNFVPFIISVLQPTRHVTMFVDKVYLDLEKRNLPLYHTFALGFSKNLQKNYPGITIKNCYSLLIQLRMSKKAEEIAYIKESIATTNRAIQNVMNHHSELNNERLAQAYHDFVILSEAKVISFDNIIASGTHATVLHYEDNNSDILPNSLLLMDVGCFTEGYSSDISRTFPVNGKFTARQKEVYEVVLNCNKKCIEFLKAGVSMKAYNDYAKKLLFEGCVKLGICKDESDLARYYYHSIGHSLGLDVHDPAIDAMGLIEGMVVTVEPGLYIEEEGIGIRIEDDVLITKDGAINLSKEIIKEVKDIEKFMK